MANSGWQIKDSKEEGAARGSLFSVADPVASLLVGTRAFSSGPTALGDRNGVPTSSSSSERCSMASKPDGQPAASVSEEQQPQLFVECALLVMNRQEDAAAASSMVEPVPAVTGFGASLNSEPLVRVSQHIIDSKTPSSVTGVASSVSSARGAPGDARVRPRPAPVVGLNSNGAVAFHGASPQGSKAGATCHPSIAVGLAAPALGSGTIHGHGSGRSGNLPPAWQAMSAIAGGIGNAQARPPLAPVSVVTSRGPRSPGTSPPGTQQQGASATGVAPRGAPMTSTTPSSAAAAAHAARLSVTLAAPPGTNVSSSDLAARRAAALSTGLARAEHAAQQAAAAGGVEAGGRGVGADGAAHRAGGTRRAEQAASPPPRTPVLTHRKPTVRLVDIQGELPRLPPHLVRRIAAMLLLRTAVQWPDTGTQLDRGLHWLPSRTGIALGKHLTDN
jgi:hypothetical protein